MAGQEYRIERDSMGEVKVPVNALYGAQTQRAVDNFPISDLRFPRTLVRALGIIKGAAASVNLDLGLMKAEMAAAIERAAKEVAEGGWDVATIKAMTPRDLYAHWGLPDDAEWGGEAFRAGDSLHLDPVALLELVAGIRDPGLQAAIVREQDQAFAVRVQASGRVHVRNGDEILQGRPVARRTELADRAEGLVEQDELRQGRVRLLWYNCAKFSSLHGPDGPACRPP